MTISDTTLASIRAQFASAGIPVDSWTLTNTPVDSFMPLYSSSATAQQIASGQVILDTMLAAPTAQKANLAAVQGLWTTGPFHGKTYDQVTTMFYNDIASCTNFAQLKASL